MTNQMKALINKAEQSKYFKTKAMTNSSTSNGSRMRDTLVLGNEKSGALY